MYSQSLTVDLFDTEPWPDPSRNPESRESGTRSADMELLEHVPSWVRFPFKDVPTGCCVIFRGPVAMTGASSVISGYESPGEAYRVRRAAPRPPRTPSRFQGGCYCPPWLPSPRKGPGQKPMVPGPRLKLFSRLLSISSDARTKCLGLWSNGHALATHSDAPKEEAVRPICIAVLSCSITWRNRPQ